MTKNIFIWFGFGSPPVRLTDNLLLSPNLWSVDSVEHCHTESSGGLTGSQLSVERRNYSWNHKFLSNYTQKVSEMESPGMQWADRSSEGDRWQGSPGISRHRHQVWPGGDTSLDSEWSPGDQIRLSNNAIIMQLCWKGTFFWDTIEPFYWLGLIWSTCLHMVTVHMLNIGNYEVKERVQSKKWWRKEWIFSFLKSKKQWCWEDNSWIFDGLMANKTVYMIWYFSNWISSDILIKECDIKFKHSTCRNLFQYFSRPRGALYHMHCYQISIKKLILNHIGNYTWIAITIL